MSDEPAVAGGLPGGIAIEDLPSWQLARRRRIVEAAQAALSEHEYERIQIRDVAGAAGVALGTLYRYFSSKEHLYAAVLQEWAAFERARPTRVSVLPTAERVRRRMHAVIKAFQREPQFFKVHVLLQSSADPHARVLLTEFAQVAQSSLADEFDMFPPEEARDLAVMLWSIVNSMTTQSIYRGSPVGQVFTVVDRFVDLLQLRLDALEAQVRGDSNSAGTVGLPPGAPS